MQLLNEKQRDGLAKVFDNFATACAVAAVLGGYVDHKLVLWQAVGLVFLAIGFLGLSWILRMSDGGQDD